MMLRVEDVWFECCCVCITVGIHKFNLTGGGPRVPQTRHDPQLGILPRPARVVSLATEGFGGNDGS